MHFNRRGRKEGKVEEMKESKTDERHKEHFCMARK